MWFARLYINDVLIKEEYEFYGRIYRRDVHLDEFSIAESIERFYEDLTESQEDLLNDFVEELGDLDFYRYSKSINLDGDIIKVVSLDEADCADFVLSYFEEFEHEFGDNSKYNYHIFSDYTQVGDYLDVLIFDNLNEIIEDFNKIGLEDYLNQLEYLEEESKKALESLKHFLNRIGEDYLENIPIPSLLVDVIVEDTICLYDLVKVNTIEDVENMFQNM